MEDSVAFDAMVWLLYASGPIRQVNVNFMGGEPLLRFKLIKKLVPFAKRRAMQMGKSIHFGMTTNGTLVSEGVIQFWKKWGMGFHTSIDGTPEVQDRNRPTTGNKGSARLVEKAVPQILAARPNTTARSTVVPETAQTLADSYHYFRKLGYISIAFVPGAPSFWCEDSISQFEAEFARVTDLWMNDLRQGIAIHLYGIDEGIRGIIRKSRYQHSCGAGRGLLLVDIHGDIWPCHRWNKQKHTGWRIGNIYSQFNELSRQKLDVADQTILLEQDCPKCLANTFCSGGCPAENLEETGAVYRRHLNACQLTRVFARAAHRAFDCMMAEKNATFRSIFFGNRDEAVAK